MPTVVLINPNSSSSVTFGLEKSLSGLAPPGLFLKFVNPPPSRNSPESINDPITSVLSASASWIYLQDEDLLEDEDVIGFLVCCFSDHPLTHMLRFYYETKPVRKTVMNILESSICRSLSLNRKFGILTTGSYWKKPLTEATKALLDPESENRFVGVICSGLGVVEAGHNENILVQSAAELVQNGATVIILGCAGMAGASAAINQGLIQLGLTQVEIIDGAEAGLGFFIQPGPGDSDEWQPIVAGLS